MDKQHERDICLSLKEQGLSRAQIAKETGLSWRQVKRRLSNHGRTESEPITADFQTNLFNADITVSTDPSGWQPDRDRHWGEFPSPPELKFPTFQPFPNETPLLSTDSRLFDYKEADKQREAIQDMVESRYRGKAVKILYLADLHIPFTDYETVFKVVEANRDASIVVINGDLLDCFGISKFAKNKSVALRKEMEDGRKFLEYLSERFEMIVLTDGNHERRLRRFIENEIPADMQFLFPKDILRVVVDGEVLGKGKLSNVHVVGGWWVKLFDTIYAHPDNYSSMPMRTIINTSQHFLLARNIPHRVCVIGHTHQAGDIVRGGVKMMETGCLAHDMDYHFGSKFTQSSWTKAHMVQYISKDGLTDFNATRIILL